MRSLKDIVRVYPIRKSKTEWEIPLHCYHICNHKCSQMYVREQNDLNTLRYVLVDNPEYVDNKCPQNGQLERTFVQLSSFNKLFPIGGTGPLYEPYNIVIPDNNFSVMLTYPLSNFVNFNINSPTSNGFTLTMLLYHLKKLYEYVYKEEERTSTSHLYHLKKNCDKCTNKLYTDYINDFIPKSDSECSICYNNYAESILQCGHYFHTQCILRWMEMSTTCPLCRKHIIDCDKCNGSGIIHYDYNGVVIPLEYRGQILNRNTTDGIFGIFGHDLEDLIISHIHYNRVKKILTLYIGS